MKPAHLRRVSPADENIIISIIIFFIYYDRDSYAEFTAACLTQLQIHSGFVCGII